MAALKFILFVCLCTWKPYGFYIFAFNLSPVPNLQFEYPGHREPNHSSYFGYSLLLRDKSLIIGAPKANLAVSKVADETGTIYSCNTKSAQCQEINIRLDANSPWHTANQWLGGSIAGGTKEDDTIMVCAPRHTVDYEEDGYFMDGICYEINPSTDVIKPISPYLFEEHLKNTNSSCWQYDYAETGFSLYYDATKTRTIIGAPGAFHWHGSTIVYSGQDSISSYPFRSCRKSWSYLGYSVLTIDLQKPSIVAGAPKYSNSGSVLIYDVEDKTMSVKLMLNGSQKYEYFGYSMITADLNADHIPDIIVSAPLHDLKNRYDVGVIYVFVMRLDLSYVQTIITPPKSRASGTHFGQAMVRLGDINQDSFDDIAVAAPFDNNGVVYLYHGSRDGLRAEPDQELTPPQFLYRKFGYGRSNSFMFGHSLASGVDVDSNGSNDLVIGAPNVEYAFLYLTYPVIHVQAHFEDIPDIMSVTNDVITFRTCLKFMCNATGFDPATKLNFNAKLKSRKFDSRFVFVSDRNDKERYYNFTVEVNEKNCKQNSIYIRKSLDNQRKPFEIAFEYELEQKPVKSEFCKQCVAIDRHTKGAVYKTFHLKYFCNNASCSPDLGVKLVSHENLNTSKGSLYFVRGKYDEFSMIYEVKNQHDQAYMPRLNISTNHRLLFLNIPKFCADLDGILQCDAWLGNSLLLKQNETREIRVSFCTDSLKQDPLIVRTEVFSDDKDRRGDDNLLQKTIHFWQTSTIEVVETTMPQTVYVTDDDVRKINITKNVQIKNLGPSTLTNITVPVSMPFFGTNTNRSENARISNKTVTVVGKYDSKLLLKEKDVVYRTDRRFTKPDVSKIPKVSSENGPEIQDRSLERPKRQTTTDESPQNNTAPEFEYSAPADALIVCKPNVNESCFQDILALSEFKTNRRSTIWLTVNFTVDLKHVSTIMRESGTNVFNYRINVGVEKNKKVWNRSRNKKSLFTTTIHKNIHDVVFVRLQPLKSAQWVQGLSFIAGILIYILISYYLYKIGFFKRKKFVRSETQPGPYIITDSLYKPPTDELKKGHDNEHFVIDDH